MNSTCVLILRGSNDLVSRSFRLRPVLLTRLVTYGRVRHPSEFYRPEMVTTL